MNHSKPEQHLPFRNRFAAYDPRDCYDAEERACIERKEIPRRAARKATGPTTPEGKRIAAQNARKHGYAGATMAISDEDRPAYRAHVEAYMHAFNPQNQPQSDAVRLAANALWRTDRLTTIEASLLELEIEWNTPFTDASLSGLEMRHHIAIAFVQNLTEGSNALDLCRRYLSSAQRDFHRAINTFEKLKQLTSPVQIPEPQPEPEPLPEPDPAPTQEPEQQQPAAQSAEPAQPAPKLQLVQRDPNELTPKTPSGPSQAANHPAPNDPALPKRSA